MIRFAPVPCPAQYCGEVGHLGRVPVPGRVGVVVPGSHPHVAGHALHQRQVLSGSRRGPEVRIAALAGVAREGRRKGAADAGEAVLRPLCLEIVNRRAEADLQETDRGVIGRLAGAADGHRSLCRTCRARLGLAVARLLLNRGDEMSPAILRQPAGVRRRRAELDTALDDRVDHLRALGSCGIAVGQRIEIAADRGGGAGSDAEPLQALVPASVPVLPRNRRIPPEPTIPPEPMIPPEPTTPPEPPLPVEPPVVPPVPELPPRPCRHPFPGLRSRLRTRSRLQSGLSTRPRAARTRRAARSAEVVPSSSTKGILWPPIFKKSLLGTTVPDASVTELARGVVSAPWACGPRRTRRPGPARAPRRERSRAWRR